MLRLSRLTLQKLVVTFSLLCVMILTTTPALAGRPHFSKDVTFSEGSLIAEGDLAGLGNRDVIIVLQGFGTGTAMCTNQGGNQAPGRNPIEVNVEGVESVPATLIDNGKVHFRVETADPTLPSATAAGCPNGKWKVTDMKVDWTLAIITVTDAESGDVLLEGRFEDPL